MGAARKRGEFPIQLMSLDAITVDRSLQSRVATSIEYQREFSEAMLRGDEFPPVTVFFDGEKNWLSDGFHRHGAAKKAGKREIRAEVREGTKRDAVLFSAGANQKFSIPRTPEDIRKAVEMILSDEEGFMWSLSRIGRHIGISPQTARGYRAVFLNEKGLVEPEKTIDEDGRRIPRRNDSPSEWLMYKRESGGGKDGCYVARKAGREPVYLSTHKAVAEDKLKELKRNDPPPPVGARKCDSNLASWFRDRGYEFTHHCQGGYDWIWGHHGHGKVFVYVEDATKVDFLAAIGRVRLLRQKLDPSALPVILCHHDELDHVAVGLARKDGIEVMTAEEFLESLKGREGEGEGQDER